MDGNAPKLTTLHRTTHVQYLLPGSTPLRENLFEDSGEGNSVSKDLMAHPIKLNVPFASKKRDPGLNNSMLWNELEK